MIDASEAGIAFFIAHLMEWGQRHFADFPWRTTDNHWHALVAEIMLQRTRAEQVVPAYEAFTRQYPTPADFHQSGDQTVFATLGLHWRQQLLEQLADTLTDQAIPSERVALLNLPGVGDYIAAAYRSLHLDLYDVIIDSNVVRLYGRFFGFETDAETRRKKWFIDFAHRLTPAQHFRTYNYALIDFTRAICKPKPACAVCPLAAKCCYAAGLPPG